MGLTRLSLFIGLLALSACSGGGSGGDGDPAPEVAEAPQTEGEAAQAGAMEAGADTSAEASDAGATATIDTPAAASDAGAAATIGTAAADPRAAVLAAILGTGDVSGWSVTNAFDLGSMKMATLSRAQDAQPVTLVALENSERGVLHTKLLEAFQTGKAADDGSHPLDILGYDLVQPQSASELKVEAAGVPRRLPRLDYAWMRVDEDSGERETGSGIAVWLRCEEADGETSTWSKLVSVESPKAVHTDGLAALITQAACR